MANKCLSCGKFYAQADGAKCSKCNTSYHKLCLSPDVRITNKWQCKQCKSKLVKPSDDLINDCVDSVQDIQLHTPSLTQEIKLLRSELSSFRMELARLSTIVNDFNNRIIGMEERISSLEQQPPQTENTKLVETVEMLKRQLNETEQDGLLNDVEFSCVPEVNGENPQHLVITLAHKLGIKLEDHHIISAHRVGRRRTQTNGSPSLNNNVDNNRPRALVARLVRRQLRDELLRAARVRRGADTAGTGIGTVPVKFYVNERLTSLNRKLFYLARSEGSSRNWRYVWIKGGRIYMRRDSNSPFIIIKSESDLHQVFPVNTV
ncbi:uncharacterized protein LOC123701028 [Colias croceus]|uniref:uncharacterized protein LOC123701028 n=1 Tax=Colias crocea TaxID=72248 RepID=UPI001E27CCE5|nr:uncharacterized protein LOC123701028 [Colias croceus]